MKSRLKTITKKAFALIMATAMSMPTAALAAEEPIKVYDQNTSVMGLAENSDEKKEVRLSGDNSVQKETDSYKMDMRASFDGLDKIIYEVKISKKTKSVENNGEVDAIEDLGLNFTPNPNSSIKEIKLLSAKALSPQGTKEITFEENTNKADLDSLKLKGAIEDEIVLEIAADIRQAEDSRTYDMVVSLFSDKDLATFSYNLIAGKEIIKEDDKEIEKISLNLDDKERDNLKGVFEGSEMFGLLSSKANISWTDYLPNETSEKKEISYEFKLDDKQETKDSKINIDYYENTQDGYVLKKEFSQSIDFANKIEFEIPADYIAKLSLKTKVDKNNTDVKSYSLNNRQVKNPAYKEKEKNPAEDDEEDHQADSKTEEKPNDSDKKDTDTKIDDKNNESGKESDTEIRVTDSNGKEVPVEIKENTDEEIRENQANKISALILNKDSLLSKLEAENKLDEVKKSAIENLASDLDSYNDEKITDQELRDFTKKLAENYAIEKNDLKTFIEAILSGLNKETNKAANLNIDEIIDYAYPEEVKPEEKDQSQKADEDKKKLDLPSVENLPKDGEENKPAEENPDPGKKSDEDLANLEDEAKKEENKTGLIEGLKNLVGLSDLAKADKELKRALADESKTLEEIQNLLDTFETKYNLSKADQAKLMDDNGDAIRALVEKDKNTNLRPHIFANTGAEGELNLDNKKFTIRTVFKTSNAAGPVKKGQNFIIHLDKKLTVKEGTVLESIRYNNEVIATPKYNPNDNTIEYTITRDINENIEMPLEIPVDYNKEKIKLDPDGTFTVTNKVSGLGLIDPPKDLVPQKMDKNGNPAGSIIEPDRDDVTKIIDDEKADYNFDMDLWGDPVVENGELKGFNFTLRVNSTKDLKELGYKLNLTTVKGSGLGEIEKVKLNNKDLTLTDNPIKGQLGIVDSKHHDFIESGQSLVYNFYTPITNKQESYMIDASIFLKNRDKKGAVRLVLDEGYPHDKVKEATPNRVGINNRTTILGEYTSEKDLRWTVTDAVSTGDSGKLPIENDRKINYLKFNETKNRETSFYSNSNVYKIDPSSGKMIVDNTGLSGIKEVGTIAVYEKPIYDSNDDVLYQTLGGVTISKYQDIVIDQNWNLPEDGMTMPAQTITAKDNKNKPSEEVKAQPGKQRTIVISDVKYWNIVDGKATKNDIKIEQEFKPEQIVVGDKTYKYNENANYYQRDTKSYYIHNSAIEKIELNPVTFTVVKVDSKNPSKKLAGARFKLLGDNQPTIVTDDQGKATFNNVYPGKYTLIEEKAPAGYKPDPNNKTIVIDKDGNISVDGGNIQVSGGKNVTKLVQHDSAPNWPDYMNAMHYGKISDNGELEFYLYLKPESNNGKDGTNRNTRLNISIPGGNITEVKAYDVSPGYRNNVRYSMEQQNADEYIPLLGNNVIGASNNNVIKGTQNKQDPYTGKTGYEIYFPQARFENDWGFLVKVKANVGDKESVSLDYDWLTNEDTAGQTKLTQSVILNKTNGQGDSEENQILVTNEEFVKSPIATTKFGDTFNADGNRERLEGAEFVLKDSNGNVIANKFTDDKGTADFKQFPPGTYRLEEKSAPDGYQKNGVYFEVVVDDQGQVTYTARFEDGIGTPQAGQDYYIEKGEETGGSNKATVTNVNQRLEYLENEPGDIGTKTGVWEAYSYESLKYHADITLSNSDPGTRFEIQFDRNLDFTQYFSEFPKVVIDGVEVADPYFDYNTNLLTYVFNKKSKGGQATASINLRGIIPDKYFAKETGKYTFNIKVAPGQTGTNIGGNPNLTKEINADYGRHHSQTGDSNQSYYFRDVYQKEDGNWYVTVLTYLNPHGDGYSAKTVRYNWITTDFQSDRIAEWSGKGYEPLYELNDVKVYATDYGTYRLGDLPLNRYMPLSMGIRPEQEPNIYHLLAHQAINPKNNSEKTQNGIYIKYDSGNIKTSEKLATKDINKAPLIVKTPKPKDKGGYVVEQTFKITDIEKFNTKWRAFYMNDGNLTSAFASKANVNTAIGDQAGGEIPKYYREIVGLINNKYKPGSFKLTKYDETNRDKKLPNATFALKDENGKVIYRTSDANGEVNFDDIAPGRYSLEEVRSPEGYQITNKKWQVIVLSDGSVRIRETSITGAGQLYTGNKINIPVSNKPVGEKFRVYKKNGNGEPLPGAKFKISDPEDPNFSAEAISGENGIVEFEANLKEGKNYILQEVEPPTGYNRLNKKWVLRLEDGKTKVYNYSDPTEAETVEKSLLGEAGTEWVDVKNRNTSGWSNYDNRWTGWADNNHSAEHLGTRIIAINKKEKYVVQRYIINPEAKNIDGITAATIHREKPEYPNMYWYNGDEEIKVFTLEPKEDGNTDGKVTGLISDLRFASYKVTDITEQVTGIPDDSHYGEPDRLKLELPKTDKPIVVDVKIPYKDEYGGVGTGMDWREANTTYWKSDYYERVSDIKTAGLVSDTGGTIVGSYLAEGSLDVTNSLKTYGFKIKKVKEDQTTAIPGATFKLTGPDPSTDERFMTTDKDGMISFDGLKPGKYTLVEEKPAPGYEKSNVTWTVRVTDEGKVYIKTNEPESVDQVRNAEVSIQDPNNPATVAPRSLFRSPMRVGLLESASEANSSLEFGDILADVTNPLRGGNGWEIVDNSSPTQPTKREDASDSEFGQLIDTKIIEIDKENNRYKQVFIYKEGYAKKNRNIKFHRAYDNYDISPNEVTTRVFQVPNGTSLANINESSDIDSIPGKTDISKNVRFTAEGTKKIQTTNINTRYPGTILIEVETNYNENYPIGLGSNYNFNTGGTWKNKSWLEKSYPNEDGVPVVKTTVYHTVSFDGNGGTWKMDPVEVEDGTEYELPGSSFIAPEGKEFDVWLVNGQKKNPGDRITVTSDLTITAQWKDKAPEQATVSFSPGEGSGTMVDQKVNIGSKYTLPDNGFTAPKGKEFKAWSVNRDEYQPGASITVNVDTRITALWKDKAPTSYNVIVQKPDQEGGTVTAEPTSAPAGTEITLTVTLKDGYEIESVTMNGEDLTAGSDGKYRFNMPEGGATVSATFKKIDDTPDPEEGWKEITADSAAHITNKQTGLDLKIYKKDRYDRKLEGAIFTIRKTDKNFEIIEDEDDFGVKTGTSNSEGLVEFKDKNGNKVNLPVGYYVIEETAAPLGYRKPNAPWKVQVVEENGQLVAKYKGPEETPQSFIEKNEDLGIKEANGVKYATKITHIDTESRTFIQRVYIDTRGKNGVVNVQIKPKHKREEIDRPGLPPVTIKEGVKTAYRSTYKISGIDGDPNEAQMIKILNDYDVSYPDVTVVNTARWRPFDWGFDEDQLNLEPGVYYIDIEGFYDTSIIDRNVTNEVAIDNNYNFTQKDEVTPSDEPVLKDPYELTADDIPDVDLGKIDIDIEFYDGAREFQQLKNVNGTITYRAIKDENGKDEASFQGGAETLRQWLEDNYDKTRADNWANTKPAGKKYTNALGKNVNIGSDPYITGIITPPLTTPSSTIKTSMDISSLYSSDATNTVPQEGLSIENDAERYNITFSKHGKDTDTDSIEKITKKRLEGAVFKLEKRVREGIYEEVEGSYVSSAFNGYFGFRGLEPGRYRLIEVQAPKNYKPIDGPLLHFSVETVSIVSQRITDPRTGENIDVNTVGFYFPGNDTAYKFEDLEMRDPVTKEVIKFKDVKNVDLDTTKIIDPTDSTQKTEVSLRELSIKFPGEIKDKEGNPVKDTYTLKEIQVTPTSNGYISLEYDKANGVYQYIPEKSTKEEDGLLVDYVTSATAKNMGKIVNEKPGKGSVTINKVDENGDALKGTANEKGELIAGAKFRLTNLTDGSTPVEKIVGEDGTLKFEGLKIGNYQLEEIESPDGHINGGQVWHFTVGGKDLDPYSEDIAPTGRDLSGQIKLTESKMTVVSPINENGAPTKEGEIHPHLGESLVFDNSYEVPEGIKINPGDHFTLTLKKSTDLHGIFENSIDNLDIFADGVGTIAKANYNREAGTITYTFTKYADTYELKNISNKISAFINLDVIRQSQNNIPVGFMMNNEDKSSEVNVVYDLKTERKDDGVNFINYTSKIVKYNPQTGEFVHYFYINRDRKPTRAFDFNFLSDQNLENVVVTEYKVLNNLKDAMPESFGVDENSNNLSYGRVINSTNYLPAGDLLTTPYYNGVTRDGSYIVKITGKVSDEDKSKYVGYSHIIHYYGNGYVLYADRFDEVHQFVNEAAAEAKLSIKAINPSNKIVFKKINNNSDALKDATFQLYKKNNNGEWDSHDQPIKTKDDGLIEYSELPEGEYYLKETTAPTGYVKVEGPVAEFKVDKTGKIFRKEVYKDKNGQDQTRYIEEPGVVPINLVNNKEQEVVLKKVDQDGKTLEGAEFEVWYKPSKDGEYSKESMTLYKDANNNLYALKSDNNVPTGFTKLDKFTSGEDGLVKFKVSEPGYYAIEETKAPQGHMKSKDKFVKEFVLIDGMIQEEKYLTEMDVKKTTGWSMSNDVFQKSYTTKMTLRFNPNHEDMTYVKDKSTITLSDLPLKAEIWDNKFNAKEPISITAYLVDGDNNESDKKSITLDLTKDYNTNLKGSKTIDLYSLVKELENQSTDGDIKSNKTLVLSMSSYLYLKSKLDIKSNIVIGDEISEDRTFHINTKGDEYVDHSYSFTTQGEMEKENDAYKPFEVVNKKVTLPNTNGLNSWLGYTIIGFVLMTIAGFIYNRKKNKLLG